MSNYEEYEKYIVNRKGKVTWKELADEVNAKFGTQYGWNSIRSKWYRLKSGEEDRRKFEETSKKSTEKARREEAMKKGVNGVEIRQKGKVIINWSTRTIMTDLGQWNTFVVPFNTHNAIQRAYSNEYEGKGDTQSQIATRFNFPHAKAFALYARIHGYTHYDLGQSDIEFEEGLTPEKAAEENIQAMKRKAVKLTEVAKWKRTQSDADKWNNFEHSVVLPTKDWIEVNLPKFKAEPIIIDSVEGKFAGVVGISDWHYMKLCLDVNGEEVYNRKIAIEKLHAANNSLISKMLKFGKPEKLFVIVGSDNIHVDNPGHTTTKFTPMGGATDGAWENELDNYVKTVIGMIDRYSQIAPVDVISLPGNHDKHTSIMLRLLLSTYYQNSERVTVKKELDRRVYRQYGKSCLVFTHGDDMSMVKLQSNVHRFIMAEAKEHGITIDECETFVLYSGHIHTKLMAILGTKSGGERDLGIVQHVIFPSLSGEDRWHKESGFVGNKQEALLDIIDVEKGRSLTLYS